VITACEGGSNAGAGLEYRYTRSEGAHLLSDPTAIYQVLVPETREIWIAPDGSGRVAIDRRTPIFFGERDRVEWEALSRTNPSIDERFGPGGLTYVDVEALPAALADIRASIVASVRDDSLPKEHQIFFAVRRYLRETLPPSGVARSLMALLLETDGIAVEREVRDPLDRKGIGFAITSTGPIRVRERLILDPETGLLLAEDRMLLEPVASIAADPPVIIGHVTYVSWGITESVEERPPASTDG
jgi:hypothetical protein